MRLHVDCSSNGCTWLGVGYGVGSWLEEVYSFSKIDSCTHMHANRLSMRDIDNACMFAGFYTGYFPGGGGGGGGRNTIDGNTITACIARPD